MTLVETVAMPACALVAWGACWALSRRFTLDDGGRNHSLDGLRGLMALLVFINHANVWFNYTHRGVWDFPPAYDHLNLGGAGVAVFFALTGYLFFHKLDASGGTLRWKAFFVSRVMRLYPAYVFVGLVTALLVTLVTAGRNMAGLSATGFGAVALDWISFGYSSVAARKLAPALAVENMAGIDVSVMYAKVFWSLPYEIFFYAALPLFALCLGGRPGRIPLIVGVAGMIALYKIDRSLSHQIYFLVGALAVRLGHWPAFRRWCGTAGADLAALAALAALIAGTRETWGWTPALLLIAIAFALIANGASLFGLLSSRPARLLGEVSYSLYVIHGLVLYGGFALLIGPERAGTFTPAEHWLAVAAMAPVVVGISFAMFRGIERPGIALGRRLAGKSSAAG